MRSAKLLIGSYAHLKPDQPETFLASIAAVLAQYPLGLVQECADPRTGAARKIEFLSLHRLVEWCDARLAYHQQLASYRPRPRDPGYGEGREFTEEERATAQDFMTRLAAELASKLKVSGQSARRAAPTDDELREMYQRRDAQEAAE